MRIVDYHGNWYIHMDCASIIIIYCVGIIIAYILVLHSVDYIASSSCSPLHACELLRVMTFEVQMSSLAISTHTRMGEPGDGDNESYLFAVFFN